MTYILIAAFFYSCGFSAWAAPAAQPAAGRIGVAAAIRGRVEALPSAARAASRVLTGGDPIFLNDKITTDAKGRLQVVLLDETVFTLGPNSNMVLDKFVYNPESGAGEVSADVVKGYFRFITGKVGRKNPSKFKVKVPVGTLGIFGTIVSGKIEGGDTTVLLEGPGAGNNASEKAGRVVVEAKAGGSVELSRPGYAVTVGQKGITAAFKAQPDLLAGISRALIAVKAAKADAGKAVDADYDSAESYSGQDSAAGVDNLAGLEDVSGLGAALDQAGTEALGGGLEGMSIDDFAVAAENYPNPPWSTIRQLQGTATLTYDGGVASFLQGSGPCAGGFINCMGSWGYSLIVNFDSRSIGGTAYITTTNINDSTVISKDYSASAGDASFTVPTADTNGNYSFDFINAGLNTHDVSVNGSVVYNDGTDSGASAADGFVSR